MDVFTTGYGRRVSIKAALLFAFVFLGGAGTLQATGGLDNPGTQPPPGDQVYRYPTRSLTPVNTGRSVSFVIRTEAPARYAVKTNLLYGATLTPNLGFEAVLGERTSLEISGGFHLWNREPDVENPEENNKRFWHWSIKPEFRYWLRKPFDGHFFGVAANYAQYELGRFSLLSLFDKEYYYDGTAYGGSLVYGYHLSLGRSWGMEFSAGVGAVHLRYDKRSCDSCTDQAQSYKTSYFGPTSAGIKLIFKIK